jgi:hypothetical protein
VNDTIHLGHGFELINSQWRVVKVFSKFKIQKGKTIKIATKNG